LLNGGSKYKEISLGQLLKSKKKNKSKKNSKLDVIPQYMINKERSKAKSNKKCMLREQYYCCRD